MNKFQTSSECYAVRTPAWTKQREEVPQLNMHIYIYIYMPRALRHMLRVPVGKELHPQLEFYEFPGGVGSSRWRWELQPLPLDGVPEIRRDFRRSLPPSRPPKIQLFRPSAASCALVRQPWRQDVQTSPKIAKKILSWSQHLPT